MGTRSKTPGIKKELSGRALSLILRKKLSGFAFCFAPFFGPARSAKFAKGRRDGSSVASKDSSRAAEEENSSEFDGALNFPNCRYSLFSEGFSRFIFSSFFFAKN